MPTTAATTPHWFNRQRKEWATLHEEGWTFDHPPVTNGVLTIVGHLRGSTATVSMSSSLSLMDTNDRMLQAFNGLSKSIA